MGVGVPRRRRGPRFRSGPGGHRCDRSVRGAAEFLRQARLVDFSLTDARARLTDIDNYRLEMLEFMAEYDVIIGPAMPTAAKPHHHGLVEIWDFSHLMAHNLTGWPAVVVRCGTSKEGLPVGVQIAARPSTTRPRSPWPATSKRLLEDGVRHCRCIESQAMRFGLFIPQGWRLDLVDIPPTAMARSCATWRSTPTAARGTRCGCTTTSTPCRCRRTRRPTRRGR